MNNDDTEKNHLLIIEPNTLQKQKELRYKELEHRGIPEPERSRAVEAEFTDYPNSKDNIPWPGPITGTDLAGNINLDLIPASSEPPVIQPNTTRTEPFPTSAINPYPNNPTPDPNSIGIKSNTYDLKFDITLIFISFSYPLFHSISQYQSLVIRLTDYIHWGPYYLLVHLLSCHCKYLHSLEDHP